MMVNLKCCAVIYLVGLRKTMNMHIQDAWVSWLLLILNTSWIQVEALQLEPACLALCTYT